MRAVRFLAVAAAGLAAAMGQAQAQTFSVAANFTTMTYDEFTGQPPDTMGAAGPNHFVAFDNVGISIFSKTGAPISQVSNTSFWTSALGTDPGGVVDPRILYDPASQRWFAVMITNDQATNNRILFARSNTSDPTQGFKGVAFTTTNNLFADFPTLGLDANGIYVGTNNFTAAGSRSGVGLYSVPKANLLTDTPSLANLTNNGTLSANTYGEGGLQAAVNYGPKLSSDPTPILAADNNSFTLYDFTPLNGTTGPGATLGATQYGTVQATSVPPDSPQLGTATLVYTGDDQFSGNVVQVGNFLYAVHVTGVNGRSAARWTIANATTFAIVQQGTISSSTLSFFYPSIAVNRSGDVVIGFSGSSSATYASTYAVAGTSAGGAPGGSLTFGTPVQTKAGTDYYDGDRWGDYSATTVDPADPGIFWTDQEYAATRTPLFDPNWNWATQATEIIPTNAGERRWSNTAGGSFGDAASYFTATAPVATDHVIFSRPNTSYTVAFSGTNSSNRASVRQGSVTWNLSGGSYTLSNTNTATPSLAVAEFQGTASLTVSNGTLNTKNAMIGGGTGGRGTLILSADAIWNNSGSNPVIYGGTLDNSGTVNYSQSSSGDAWRLNNGTINNLQGGIFNVTGIFWTYLSPSGGTNLFNNAGTLIKKDSATFNVEVPFSNTGTVEVRSGGISISGPVTQLSGSTLTAGTWNVLNGSTLYMSAGSNITSLEPGVTVRLSGATANFAKINSLATNNGTFQIDNGKNFTGSGAFSNNGTLIVDNASTFSVASGYVAAATVYESINLVPGNPGVFTIISSAGTIDDVTAAIDLGTDTYRLYGSDYSGANTLYVSSNGLLTLASATSTATNADLTSSPSQAAIAPLWDDWNNTSTGIPPVLGKFEDMNGDSVNDRLIVEWNENRHFQGSTNPVTFQAILGLNTGNNNGTIVFNYPDLDTGDSFANGANATVGIKAAGNQGPNRILVSFNQGNNPLIGSNKAVQVAYIGGTFANNGTIEGNGTIAATVLSHGTISPGQSAGTLTVNGSLTLFDESEIRIELGGLIAGTQYDQLVVSGSAMLNGLLNLDLINGFILMAGNLFDIFDWGTVNGAFAMIDLPSLATGLVWNTSQLYTTGVLTVGLPGDYNNDGSVDGADYVIWRKNDGTQAGYNTWRANFGNTLSSNGSAASAAESPASVPEPGSILLILSASWVAALVVDSRRRRNHASDANARVFA